MIRQTLPGRWLSVLFKTAGEPATVSSGYG